MEKILSISLVLVLIISGLAVTIPLAEDTNIQTEIINFQISNTIISNKNTFSEISIPETTTYTNMPGKPRVPIIEKTLTFPINTEISKITCNVGKISEEQITNKIILAPIPQQLGKEEVSQESYTFYNDPYPYPENWMDYDLGRGLINGERSIILKIQINPIKYLPEENIVRKANDIEITVEHQTIEEPNNEMNYEDYSLVILTPSNFKNNLLPLVAHKQSRNISTILVTIDEINSGIHFPVQGTDQQEKIKYFIKNAYDKWETQFVLLVGSAEEFPVREVYVYINREDGRDDDEVFLSDLYYADLYNEDGIFQSWNTNNNSRYAEYYWEGLSDSLDFYPDVYLGRLACRNDDEVDAVVNKIITYENAESFKKGWFNNIVLIGGDSFPAIFDETSGINEGELANQHVLDVMEGFIPNKLWASNAKLAGLNPSGVDRISDAINDGCGFVHFSGHGSHSVWTTYPHNGTKQSLPTPLGTYRTSHILELNNGYDLPIVVTGACSVGKFNTNPKCFSWSFVANPNGGGIASFGATALGYACLGEYVTTAVVEKMALEMFKAYKDHEAKTAGEMWATAINNYITPVLYGEDYKTIEEWEPFCDPTLALREEYLTPSQPPEKPVVKGPKNGKSGSTYTYTATATDPDRDQIEYLFDWGDESVPKWIGPVDSGTTITQNHTWTKTGYFTVKVKARDENGYESNWSIPLLISMPKQKPFQNTLLWQFLEVLFNKLFNIRMLEAF